MPPKKRAQTSRRMPTQTMVAERAGVSQEAVSHILGGKRANLFSEQTQEKVRKAAKLLGYQPNRAAQIMRRGRTNLVVHLNCGGYTELAGQRSYYIGRYVHEAGFDFQVIDSYWWPDESHKVVAQILSLHPEGVIVSGAAQMPLDFSPLQKAGIPVVGIGIRLLDDPGVRHDWVRHDVRGAIAELTRHCLAQGRRPVALLAQSSDAWHRRERRLGFLDALEEVGLENTMEIDVEQDAFPRRAKSPAILHYSLKATMFDPFAPGVHMARQLLEADFVPDALVCSNDHYALGVMAVLLRAGIKVPGEVFLTGYDNISSSAYSAVTLTTAEQPIEQMCGAAIDLLKKRIGRPASSRSRRKSEIVFPGRVIWRESTAHLSTEPLNRASTPKKQPLIEA